VRDVPHKKYSLPIWDSKGTGPFGRGSKGAAPPWRSPSQHPDHHHVHRGAAGDAEERVVSPEMEELIGLCNRIYVMFEGKIMDLVEGERKTQEVIINSLLGVKGNE